MTEHENPYLRHERLHGLAPGYFLEPFLGVAKMIVKGFHVDPEVPSWPEFWSRVEAGWWEPEMFALMDRFLEPGWRWVDFGAWIGPTALYAASKGARVEAYEPDPVALKALLVNLRLNPELHVTVYDYAIAGKGSGTMTMHNNNLGNSETSIYGGGQEVQVWARDVCDIFRGTGYHRDLRTIVKMDIEGSEFEVLPHLKRFIDQSECMWVVSFHNPDMLPYSNPGARTSMYNRALHAFKKLHRYDMNLCPIDHVDMIPQTLVFDARSEL